MGRDARSMMQLTGGLQTGHSCVLLCVRALDSGTYRVWWVIGMYASAEMPARACPPGVLLACRGKQQLAKRISNGRRHQLGDPECASLQAGSMDQNFDSQATAARTWHARFTTLYRGGQELPVKLPMVVVKWLSAVAEGGNQQPAASQVRQKATTPYSWRYCGRSISGTCI